MRNPKEIKEEILIRSKKRIKKRKRIISIVLAFCICVLAGVTALSFIAPPVSTDSYNNNGSGDGVSEKENYDLLADGEFPCVSEKIAKIKYGDKEFTDSDKIAQITNTLQAIINGTTDDLHAFENEGADVSLKTQSATDASADMSLRLFIVTESGNKEEFVINSNTLINKSTGVAYSMNEKDRQALLDAVK